MYVIKFSDKNDWTYYTKGMLPHGQHNWFLKSWCFKSKNKAKSHIRKILHAWWIRPGYKYANFEVIQVVPCADYAKFPILLQKGPTDHFMVVKENKK